MKILRDVIIGLSSIPSTSIDYQRVIEAVGLPYISIDRMSGTRTTTHCGGNDTVESRYRLLVCAGNMRDARKYAKELYPINGYSGGFIAHTRIENEMENYDAQVRVFQVIIDLTIQYYEGGL